MSDAEDFLARLERGARRSETPCGEGAMAWREWGDGEPLVLFHGGSGSWRHWALNIEPLARHRRLVVPDLPGLGESAMPPPVDSPAPIAAILRRGIAQVLGEGTRYDLCGFSYGALLAGHVSAQAGEELRSVTLVGAGALGVPRQPTELLRVRDKQGEARVDAHKHNLRTLMLWREESIDALALVIQEYNTVNGRFRSRGFAHTTSLKDAVGSATAPVALLYGERDAIAYPEVQKRFAALLEVAPDAWTGVIPGAGHWAAYEAPATFNAMLLEMLRRRVGA